MAQSFLFGVIGGVDQKGRLRVKFPGVFLFPPDSGGVRIRRIESSYEYEVIVQGTCNTEGRYDGELNVQYD